MAVQGGRSLAQKHVGANHNAHLGIYRTQLRPFTSDLRGNGTTLPFDRKRTSYAPAALVQRVHRRVRVMAAEASINPDDESSSSEIESVDTISDGTPPATTPAPRGLSSLAKRAIFGTILGLGGAVVILFGGWLYAGAACLVAYQCSKEFTGLVNAKGISAGMKPPPPFITSVISLLCVALNIWAYVSGGFTASAMAVSTFILLSLQLVASHRPRFSQLTSAVFGLVYCGKTTKPIFYNTMHAYLSINRKY